ncbi:EamA family transporter [Paenibacillus sp. MY03]|jgi:drug/metabolite transporter (DMT)-like permease|uniref:EamA family transporter n=1 Tax=Paenibacillus sp. MY03 TaxID=302980 RepID=UPI000B3C5751|nr:DMT family transporter [Paenibacillus sp. MY03]OUS75293.1 EamA family transporter [Paenibacillus sp. MY03]
MKHMVAVFLGAASYGILSTFVVLAYGHGYTLGEVVGSQMMIGFLLTWALSAWLNMRKKQAVKRQTNMKTQQANGPQTNMRTKAVLTLKQKLLLMLAGLPTAITGLLYYESLRYIPASVAILLLFQFTWMGVLIQAVRLRKLPERKVYLTLAILFGGTLLAAGLAEPGVGAFHLGGIVLGLLAAVSYTLFMLFNGKAVPDAEPADRSKWMMLGAMLLVFLLFPPQFLWNGDLLSPLMLYGLLLGAFGAFIPPLLFAYGIPHIGEGLAGILGAAELPVAVMLSAVVLHEEVSFLQWIGVAIVLAGVALPEWLKRLRRVPVVNH